MVGKTKYQPGHVEAMLDYFALKDSYREVSGSSGRVQLIPRLMPTMVRFALKIGVNRKTLLRWFNEKNEDGSKKYQEYCDAYEKAKDVQEIYMLEAGIVGALNPTFASLMMINVFSWRKKIEEEVKHSIASIDMGAVNKVLREGEAKRREWRKTEKERMSKYG